MIDKCLVRGLRICLVVCLAAVLPGPAHAEGAGSGTKGIEGTWMLTSRELPDGTTVSPPAIMGLLSFRDGFRNFNVYWTDADGKPFSLSLISTYEMSDSKYTETCKYMMMNDGSSDNGPIYDLSGASGTAPVTKDGKSLTIPMPLFGEPVVVFTGDRMTATREGAFVDHWARVK